MKLRPFTRVLTAAVGIGASGCALIVGLQDRGPNPDAAEAGALEASTVVTDAARENEPPDAAVDCTAIYVSRSTGSDSNSGCSNSPKQTITAAIDAAKSSHTNPEIHVCAGLYSELPINSSFTLRGSYNCTTWARTANYGYPAFDGLNETIIEPTTIGEVTVTFAGGSTDESAAIDGFAIMGGNLAAPQDFATALKVSGAAVVTNNQILGAMSSVAATCGLDVAEDANPEIRNNEIDGGSGTQGAYGIEIEANSAPSIHDNLVSTDASSQGPTYGVIVFAAGNNTGARPLLRSNHISPGVGFKYTPNPPSATSNGIAINNTGVDIIDNWIEINSDTTCMTDDAALPCETFGIVSQGDGRTGVGSRLIGNRILQNPVSVGPGTNGAAIKFQSDLPPLILNNAIISLASAAIYLEDSPGGLIEQNTVYGTVDGVLLDETSPGTTILNNLFLSDDTSGGQTLGSCGIANGCTVTSKIQNNAFIRETQVAALLPDGGVVGAGCNPTSIYDVGTDSGLNDYPDASGNVRIALACEMGETGCLSLATCTDDYTCIHPVIPSWTMDDAGAAAVSSLLSDAGWALGHSTPCLIAEGGLPIVLAGDDGGVGSPAVDINGTPRSTVSPSIGAYELQGSCTPP